MARNVRFQNGFTGWIFNWCIIMMITKIFEREKRQWKKELQASHRWDEELHCVWDPQRLRTLVCVSVFLSHVKAERLTECSKCFWSKVLQLSGASYDAVIDALVLLQRCMWTSCTDSSQTSPLCSSLHREDLYTVKNPMAHFPVWVSNTTLKLHKNPCQTNKITPNVVPTSQTQLSEQRISYCWNVKALWVPSMHCIMNKRCSYCNRIIVLLFADFV